MIAVRQAWLQKHPSPIAAGGEFHWYPREGDRELRTQLVERMRELEPPAVLWELAPGRAIWARSFAAIAPLDGRRYVGLALAIAEGVANPCELLRALEVPPAAPWTAQVEPDPSSGDALALAKPTELVALARGLLSGGPQHLAEPHARALPQLAAALEHQLPEVLTPKQRRGAWLRAAPPAVDRVAGLLVAAACAPASGEARAWRLLCELAVARRECPDDVVRTLEPTGTALIARLHAWGRGRPAEVEALADAVALRVLGELERGGDPRRPIAEARWHALLPAARRTQLLGTLAARAGSLRPLVEHPDA